MTPAFTAADGIRRTLCGTQPVISLALVECGLEIHRQANMAAIRHKSLALSALFISAVDEFSARHDLQLVAPREAARRGSHVSISHQLGYAIMQALIARGVIGDYRAPDIMRFGFTPLYTRFVDVWDAACLLGQILESREYTVFETEAAGRPTVT